MQDYDNERWLPVPGWRGLYEVSDHGRVRNAKTGRIMSQVERRKVRYRQVTLKSRPRKGVLYVHSVVLSAFVCARPPGLVCCHNDGDPTNNHVSNLRWDTPLSNTMDRIAHGRSFRGERHPGAQLTRSQVVEIRRAVASGVPRVKLAATYGVSRRTIGSIATGSTWKHVSSD